jgi:hypothetical protein
MGGLLQDVWPKHTHDGALPPESLTPAAIPSLSLARRLTNGLIRPIFPGRRTSWRVGAVSAAAADSTALAPRGAEGLNISESSSGTSSIPSPRRRFRRAYKEINDGNESQEAQG